MLKYINQLTKEQFLEIHKKCFPTTKIENKVNVGKTECNHEGYYDISHSGLVVTFYEFCGYEYGFLPTDYHYSDFNIPYDLDCITILDSEFLKGVHSSFISEMIRIFGKPYIWDLLQNQLKVNISVLDLIKKTLT